MVALSRLLLYEPGLKDLKLFIITEEQVKNGWSVLPTY